MAATATLRLKRSYQDFHSSHNGIENSNKKRAPGYPFRAVKSAPVSPEIDLAEMFRPPASAPVSKVEFFPKLPRFNSSGNGPKRPNISPEVIARQTHMAPTVHLIKLAETHSPVLPAPPSASLTASSGAIALPPSSDSSLPSPETVVAKTPTSLSTRRKRLGKDLFLVVPPSGSSSGDLLQPGPRSPMLSGISETRSCPPTPTMNIDGKGSNDTAIDIGGRRADVDALKSSLRGDMTMARRTSLPRLNINADVRIARDCKPILTPLLPTNRLVNKPPLISMVGLVARNREAGAPVVPAAVDETVEDFPYQNGPKEILPRLFLGSEQNAKDPQLLRTLGITSIICVAKEVLCPWLAEEAIEEEGSDTDGSDSSHSDDESSRPVSQSTAHLKVSALLVPPSSHMAYSVSQHNNPPTAPVRPLYVRPTASTPNLQQRFHQAAPSTGKASSSAPRELFAASTVQCKGDSAFTHSGYLSRHFPANHLTGRPAIEYTKLPWSHDEDEIASCFQTHKICELIDRSRQAGGRCLVHCQLGVSRSATLVIGYCMRQAARGVEQGTRDLKSMHDSYTFVRSKSRWVAPNIGLLAQLVQFERLLAAESNAAKSQLPYSNSAYYDSQLSLASAKPKPATPDNLSPSFTCESGSTDSRLATPDTFSSWPQSQKNRSALHTTSPYRTGMPIEEQLSPMTAALYLTKSGPDEIPMHDSGSVS
ncbi:MAG: hypothetical protein CYPHOPRED_002183 [Cyphobasidiales sp. Tagirdzhanova-0007]|nr:MAG: hypothetical protein CYPHOPRED_002183 [Cyphobasidiales sp. Tagirdzhanova-0007]